MFSDEEPVLLVCSECESEFELKTLYSDSKVKFCPFCGEEIETQDAED